MRGRSKRSRAHRCRASPPDNLAEWINAGSKADLEDLPGFASAARALPRKTSKRKALEMMNAADTPVLPVLDEDGKFDGIVDRSKLAASILTEIAQRVEKGE